MAQKSQLLIVLKVISDLKEVVQENRDSVNQIRDDLKTQGDYTISIKGPRITLAGLSYLSENSTTSKVINAAKFLKDVIPGL